MRSAAGEIWVKDPRSEFGEELDPPALNQSITSRTLSDGHGVKRCEAKIHSFPKEKDSNNVAQDTVFQ
jgi:hypothetical protein